MRVHPYHEGSELRCLKHPHGFRNTKFQPENIFNMRYPISKYHSTAGSCLKINLSGLLKLFKAVFCKTSLTDNSSNSQVRHHLIIGLHPYTGSRTNDN